MFILFYSISILVRRHLQQKQISLNSGKIEFPTVNYNVGKVKQGIDINYYFKYKNTGETPVRVN